MKYENLSSLEELDLMHISRNAMDEKSTRTMLKNRMCYITDEYTDKTAAIDSQS